MSWSQDEAHCSRDIMENTGGQAPEPTLSNHHSSIIGNSWRSRRPSHWTAYRRPRTQNIEQPQAVNIQPNNANDTSSSFNELTHLVGERICTFLDHGDLLTLRAVCKVTKSWVEDHPKILTTLNVDLRRPGHLDRVLKKDATVHFTNFTFRLEKLNVNTISHFIDIYGSRIKILCVTTASNYFRKIDLLTKCPNLEIVTLSDLSLKKVSSGDLAKFRENFRKYVEFRLSDLEIAAGWNVKELMNWITSSTKLRHLQLPKIQFESGEPILGPDWPRPIFFTPDAEKAFDPVAEFCKVEIVQRLSTALENRAIHSLKFLDCERFLLSGSVDKESFQRLGTNCKRAGVQLINVPFLPLYPPMLKSERDYASCIQAVRSFRSYQIGKLDPSYLQDVKELTWPIGFGSFENSSPKEQTVCHQELNFPSLISLNLKIFSADEPINQELLQALLLTRERQSVQRLSIICQNPVNIQARTISLHFANIKTLEMVAWVGGQREFQDLFSGLRCLQELIIKDCKGLSDEAFVGSSDTISPFRTLTSLRKVWIRCYDRGVTDISLQHAFSLLPLRVLSINFIGLSTITGNGLNALNRLPFKNSIQYIDVQLVSGISYKTIKRLTDELGNLKKFKFS